VQRSTIYITDEQREWLVNNSISPAASNWGHEGKTQSEHFREALEIYIRGLEGEKLNN